MPPMPAGDPWPAVERLLKAERTIRQGKQPNLDDPDPYWADLVRLLQVFRYSRNGARQAQRDKVNDIKEQMTTDVYDVHILKRQLRAPVAAQTEEQLLFDTAELDAQQPASSNSNQR